MVDFLVSRVCWLGFAAVSFLWPSLMTLCPALPIADLDKSYVRTNLLGKIWAFFSLLATCTVTMEKVRHPRGVEMITRAGTFNGDRHDQAPFLC